MSILILKPRRRWSAGPTRSEEHTSELQSQSNLVCRLLLEKKKIHQHVAVLPSSGFRIVLFSPPGCMAGGTNMTVIVYILSKGNMMFTKYAVEHTRRSFRGS